METTGLLLTGQDHRQKAIEHETKNTKLTISPNISINHALNYS